MKRGPGTALSFKRLSFTIIAATAALLRGGVAHAHQLPTDPDWDIRLDNTLQYTLGSRMQSIDPNIGNHLFFHQGDYKFPNRGDLVTNRVQDLIELQAVHKENVGVRLTGSLWYDFAYDSQVKANPNNPAFGALNSYPTGYYSSYTNRYFLKGAELLDAFVFANTDIAGIPTHLKVGRLTQYWGNAFFFGFSNIAYSQHPIDYIKGFSQPGSEVKELFLPRAQVLLSTELSPELSVTAQYFFEFRPNRYPEGGTYLGFFDILFDGPPGTGALAPLGITDNDGLVLPGKTLTRDDTFYIHNNFGVKVAWSPKWAGGDMGFYYRQFDEVDPWVALVNPANGHLQGTFAGLAKLAGFSYERAFGLVSTGLELNMRFDTALNSAALVPSNKGATGTITNAIANAFVQLGKTPLWHAGVLLAEVSYTHLNKVTGNAALYDGVGSAVCFKNANPAAGPGSWKDGCSTDDAVAAAVLFSPQWLQVLPGLDLEMPMSLTTGLYGNPAYRAGAFYAQGSYIYSIGLKSTYHARHSVSLQYNGYYWRPGETADNGLGAGLNAYAGFGGNGPVSLNDRGWLQLQFKTSF